MSNHCFKNKNLSYKAKGMLAAMLSFPDGWNFSIAGLAALSSDGEASVKSALAELKEEGYVRVYSVRDSRGQISEWHYDISEVPIVDNPDVENPDVEKPHVENQPYINILSNNNTDSINNLDNREDNSSRIINNTSNNISSNRKNSKKEFDLSFVSVQFQDVFNEWLEYKRSKNQMYKRQVDVEIAYRKLLEYSGNDPKTAQDIIESAILGNYMGFFAPKTKSSNAYGNSNSNNNETPSLAKQLARNLKETGRLFS